MSMEMVRIRSRSRFTKILPGGRRLAPGEEISIPKHLYDRISIDDDIELISVEQGGVSQSLDEIIEGYKKLIQEKDDEIAELKMRIMSLESKVSEMESRAPIRSRAEEIISYPWRKRRSVIEDLDPEDDRDLLETLLECLQHEKQTKSIREDIDIIRLKLAQGEMENDSN